MAVWSQYTESYESWWGLSYLCKKDEGARHVYLLGDKKQMWHL